MTELAAPAVVTSVYKSALKASSSLRLQYRVVRLVRKRVTFHVPFWPLFFWLHRFPLERLRDSYVRSTDFLAQELEQALRGHPHWTDSSPTRSRALSVVQEVHLAFSAVGKNDPRVGAQLESLHGEFRAEVLRHLRNTEEPALRLDRADWATLQAHEAGIRRRNRLQSFGLSTAQLEHHLEGLRSTSPPVTSGNFYLLEGSYGSGKSEQAEAWLFQQIERYRLSEGAPVPIHLGARVVEQASIEDRLKSDVGLTALRTRGVALVVDGLDEIRSERASRVLEDANALVMKYPASKVLLTSRVGVLDGHLLLTETNHHVQAPLDTDTALGLIETVAGAKPYEALQNPAFQESVKLPFFALAAAVAQREGKKQSSRAGLIRALVETALRRPSVVRTSVGTTEIAHRLEQLAVNGTRRNSSDGMNEPERLRVLETGLVRRSENGDRIHFTLPLLEQWFAAQKLQADPELVEEAIRSSTAFESWRWALAIALDESQWSTYNAIIMRCLAQDLGAGSWLVRESSRRSLRIEGPTDNSVLQATRLEHTLDYVMRTVPLYKELVFPQPAEEEHLVFDVKENRGLISTDWYSTLKSEMGFQQGNDLGKLSLPIQHWGVVPSAEKTWPWDYVRERFTSGVDSRFWQHLDLGYPGGLWERERRFSLAAQFLVPRRGPLPQRISLERLRERIEELLQYVDLEALGSFESGRLKVSGAEFRDLVNWAQNCPDTEVARLTPSPMADPNIVGSADDLFPRELVDEYLLEAHGFGSEIYDQALAGLFSAFKWRWQEPDGALRGVIGVTEDSPMHRTGLDRIVMKVAVPAHLLDDIENEYGTLFDRSSNGRARFRSSAGDRGESLREAVFAVLDREGYRGHGGPPQIWSSGVLHTSGDRPASLVAHEWIRHSFSAVGLDRALSDSRRLY